MYNGAGKKIVLHDKDTKTAYPILTVRQYAFVFSFRLLGTYTTCYDQFLTTDPDDIFVVIPADKMDTFRKPGTTTVATENLSLLAYIITTFLCVQQYVRN